jgi:hypothetical protein
VILLISLMFANSKQSGRQRLAKMGKDQQNRPPEKLSRERKLGEEEKKSQSTLFWKDLLSANWFAELRGSVVELSWDLSDVRCNIAKCRGRFRRSARHKGAHDDGMS